MPPDDRKAKPFEVSDDDIDSAFAGLEEGKAPPEKPAAPPPDDVDSAIDLLERGEAPAHASEPAAAPRPTPAPEPAPAAAELAKPKPEERRKLYAYWSDAAASKDSEEPGPASPALQAAPIPRGEDTARAVARIEVNYLRYAGYMDQTPIPEIIGRVVVGRETGHLLLRRGETSKSVSFVQGDPVFATSNLDADKLSEVLVRASWASKDRVSAALEHAKRPDQLLEELGIGDVPKVMRDWVAAILESIFEWRSGEFSFVRLDPSEACRIALPSPAPTYVVNGIRKHFAKPEILRRLRGENVVPAATVLPLPDADRLSLSDVEREVLPLIDGVRTVGQILSESPRSDTAATVLYALVCLGAVRVRVVV